MEDKWHLMMYYEYNKNYLTDLYVQHAIENYPECMYVPFQEDLFWDIVKQEYDKARQ